MVSGEGLLAGKHEARLYVVLPDLSGENLLHADAAVEHGALGEGFTREDVAGHAGMDPHAGRGSVVESIDDVQLGLVRLQRLRDSCSGSIPAPSPFAHQFGGLIPVPIELDYQPFGCA